MQQEELEIRMSCTVLVSSEHSAMQSKANSAKTAMQVLQELQILQIMESKYC